MPGGLVPQPFEPPTLDDHAKVHPIPRMAALTAAGEARVTRRQDVVLTMTGGEALLIDEQSGSVHVVNGTAAQLWELCDGDPTVGELVDSIARVYELAREAVRDDVERMIVTFRELGLLEFDPPS
jgi:PqqD family protein of HPr-rel-A system